MAGAVSFASLPSTRCSSRGLSSRSPSHEQAQPPLNLNPSRHLHPPPFSLSSPSPSPSPLSVAQRSVRCQVSTSPTQTGPTFVRPEREPSSAAITYLEGNSWLLEVGGVRILVDPVLEGPLDFGIPLLYTAYKKTLRGTRVADVASLADYLLITQSLDDHCHLNTLRPLASLRPDLPVVATPNAEPLLSPLFSNVTYLEPGQATEVSTGGGEHSATVVATAGPVLGPPWQRPENGYILRSGVPGGVSVYLEPHCLYDQEALQQLDPVDVVITPVVKQLLPAYTLVSGQEDAVALAQALRARVVVPMMNGDLDAQGVLDLIVQISGSVNSFEALLKAGIPSARLELPVPGEPLCIPKK